MKLRRTVDLVVLLGVLVTAVITGCGRLPTSPAPTATQESIASARTAESAGLISGVGSLLGGVVNLLVRTLQLVGSLGGSLTNGRWKVVIPAGAVQGNGTVALGVPTTTSPDCQLEIYPSTLNHFDKSVTLIADCRNVSLDQLRNYTIYWFNPTTQQWVPVPGSTVNLTTKTVSAPLAHFSQYCVGPQGGRAGW